MTHADYLFAQLTPKQVKALPLLAIGCPAVDVAKRVKVSQAQLSEWKHEERFMAALNETRLRALGEVEVSLQTLAHEAVEVLRDVLVNSSSDNARLRAAEYVIDRIDLSGVLRRTPVSKANGVDMKLLLTALGVAEV